MTKKTIPLDTFEPKSREDWRLWLKENHQSKQQIWLIYAKKGSQLPTLSYSDAVDEALCFGWIDSRVQSIDALRYRQQFSQRKVGSVWSKVNKEKVARLITEKRMTPAGLAVINRAKKDGSWTILDEVEEGIIPPDLEVAFKNQPNGLAYFKEISRTDRRNILQWLMLAKKPETRARRIETIVAAAAERRKPAPF